MKIEEAYKILKPLEGHSLEELGVVGNKGRWGHSVEKFLGLQLGSHHLDFEDGELKTTTVKTNHTLKEDFKIAKKWEVDYLEEKLQQILLVVRNTDNVIDKVKIVKPLSHSIYQKYFYKELEKIFEIGLESVSQKDTTIWVAKTNDAGRKLKNERALYISRAFASHLFGYSFGAARKGKDVYKEILDYEQTTN